MTNTDDWKFVRTTTREYQSYWVTVDWYENAAGEIRTAERDFVPFHGGCSR